MAESHRREEALHLRPALAAVAVFGAFLALTTASVQATDLGRFVRFLTLTHGAAAAIAFIAAAVGVLERRPWGWILLAALAAAHLWVFGASLVYPGPTGAALGPAEWSLVVVGYHAGLLVLLASPAVRGACAPEWALRL